MHCNFAAVMVGGAIKTNTQISALQRFLGNKAKVISSRTVAVNKNIEAVISELLNGEDYFTEEHGMLYLTPLENQKFHLELCYLKNENNTSENLTAITISFKPDFFEQYPIETLLANQSFQYDKYTEQQFPICSVSSNLLNQLFESVLKGAKLTNSLQLSLLAMQLLQRALECISVPFEVCPVPACRFLTYESEREKIKNACAIIEEKLDRAYTIRELSRKVAINECYLKKGFKAITGKTVHEYRETLRIDKAKELLQNEKRSVTEVADILGFSSISHFSTAFKRVTGTKPCELLA